MLCTDPAGMRTSILPFCQIFLQVIDIHKDSFLVELVKICDFGIGRFRLHAIVISHSAYEYSGQNSMAHDVRSVFRYRTISMDSYIHRTLPFSFSMRRHGTWLLPPPAIRSVLFAG